MMKRKMLKGIISLLMLGLGTGFLQAQTEKLGRSSADLFNAIKIAVDAKEREQILEEMKTVVGDSKDRQSTMLLDYATQYVAITYAEENNPDKAVLFKDRVTDSNLKMQTESSVARELLNQQAYTAVQRILANQVKDFNIESTTKLNGDKLQAILLYGEALYGEGKKEKALPYLKTAMEAGQYAGHQREKYVLALVRSGKQEEAAKLIEPIILEKGTRSKEFLAEAEKMINKQDGNSLRFEILQDSARRLDSARIESLVLANKVNRPAPDFTLKDLKGNTVSLSSLKGKTVIVDLWATWCIPCVASFPGMQRAVDYYKNDPSVVFLFVHTAEKKSADVAKDAKALIDNKGYTFDVYLDLLDSSGKNPILTAFGAKSLPTKYVINKEGIIKFDHSGFVGEEDAVAEIKKMVELANQ